MADMLFKRLGEVTDIVVSGQSLCLGRQLQINGAKKSTRSTEVRQYR